MVCSRCQQEAPALKTVRWRDRHGSRFALCDPCHAPIAGAVMIVPGPVVCFGTCRRCRAWASIRDLAERTGGGKWDAPSGVCARCAR